MPVSFVSRDDAGMKTILPGNYTFFSHPISYLLIFLVYFIFLSPSLAVAQFRAIFLSPSLVVT